MRPVMDQCGSEGGEVKRVEFSFDYTGPSSYQRGLGKDYAGTSSTDCGAPTVPCRLGPAT